MNKIIGVILVFLSTFIAVDAGYHCNTADDCIVFCNNIENSQMEMLKNTQWIAVPYTDGNCYFHNKETKEDADYFPIKEVL